MPGYVRLELRRQFRNWQALFVRIGIPAGFYLLAAAGRDAGDRSEGLPAETAAMVALAAFGVTMSGLFATGPPLAQERASGWLRQLRAMPLPAGAAVVGKIAAALAFALPSILLVAAVAEISEGIGLGWDRWIALIALMWIATIPLAALGVLIGFTVANADVAEGVTAVALVAMGALGGMFVGVDELPAALQEIAPLTPTHAVRELGFSVARGDAVPDSAVGTILGWTCGLSTLAAVGWDRLAGVR